MQSFYRTALLEGMRCIITSKYRSSMFSGKEVFLVKSFIHPDNGRTYWETFPKLKAPDGNGVLKTKCWASSALMCVEDPAISRRLVLERREDCQTDPRIASYILGKKMY